jgi:hypothetical protein
MRVGCGVGFWVCKVVRIAAIISVYAGWNWVYAEAVSQTGKFSI